MLGEICKEAKSSGLLLRGRAGTEQMGCASRGGAHPFYFFLYLMDFEPSEPAPKSKFKKGVLV